MSTRHLPFAAEQLAALSAAQRQRLAYIEFRVWFHGEVARKDVLARFEIATAAGTRDLALYQSLAPHNVTYARKAFRHMPSFSPLFEHDVNRVLAALTQGFAAGDAPTHGDTLPHASPVPLNLPDLDTLATVTRAMAQGQALCLTYHSMKKGPAKRHIVPHALVDSGLRWHVRAYDRNKREFRDLVLTRMQAVKALADAPLPHELATADAEWQRELQLVLKAHPAHPQPAVIALDFGMQGGQLRLPVRAAVAGHVLRQWQVDCSEGARLRGHDMRLMLANREVLNGVGSAVLAPGWGDAG